MDKQEVEKIIREYLETMPDIVPGVNSPLLTGETSILNYSEGIGAIPGIEAELANHEARIEALENP